MLRNWDLIKELTWSDFKLRYNSSILGFLWSFLKPLLMLTILYIVFSLLIDIKIENYALFLLLGIILWNFFYESTTISMSNILSKRSIIKSVYFPRKILVISSCLNALMTLLINLIIFFIIFFISGLNISLFGFMVFLFLLVMLFLISLGVSYILSSFYTKYRDLNHIWEIFLQIGFFITPIIYNAEIIPRNYLSIYLLNPLARILIDSKNAVLYGIYPVSIDVFVILLVSSLIYTLGFMVYQKRSKYFAEEI